MLLSITAVMLCWAPVEYPEYELCWRYQGDSTWQVCVRTDARCMDDPAPTPRPGELIEYRVEGLCDV